MQNVWMIISVAVVWCVGCSKAQVTSTRTHDVVTDYPILVQLEGTSQTFVIKSGPTGPLYSVITSDGEFMVRDLTFAELELNHPQLHDGIKSAIALDARLDRRRLSRP